jgi:hypothetical protein
MVLCTAGKELRGISGAQLAAGEGAEMHELRGFQVHSWGGIRGVNSEGSQVHTCSWGGIRGANSEGSQVHSWGGEEMQTQRQVRCITEEEPEVRSQRDLKAGKESEVQTQWDLRCIAGGDQRCRLRGSKVHSWQGTTGRAILRGISGTKLARYNRSRRRGISGKAGEGSEVQTQKKLRCIAGEGSEVQTHREFRYIAGEEIKHTGIRGPKLGRKQRYRHRTRRRYTLYNYAEIPVKQCSGESTDGS